MDAEPTDADCLDRWIDGRDAEAFATLARRHAGLVYHAARRQLGDDATLAEDVTQATFVVLARRPAQARRSRSLAAWLHVVTRHAVANARRGARRRMIHERRAAATRPEATMPAAPADDLRPILDDAIATLGDRDRTAIVERYLNGSDVATVATTLGASVEATQKRIERATAKLRAHLMKRGIAGTTTTAAIVTALGATAQPAPAHVAALAATAPLAPTAAGATLAKGTITMMTKTKSITLATAAVLLVAATATTAVVLTQQVTTRAATAPAAATLPAKPLVATTSTVAVPVGQPVATDRSTPRAAIAAYLRAEDRYDADTMRRGVYTATEDGRQMLDAAIDWALARQALAEAVRERIGADALALVINDNREAIAQTLALPEAAVQVEGDRATVALDEDAPVTPLVRVDGEWRMDIEEYARLCRSTPAEEIEQAQTGAARLNAVTARVRSGEIATREALRAAYYEAVQF